MTEQDHNYQGVIPLNLRNKSWYVALQEYYYLVGEPYQYFESEPKIKDTKESIAKDLNGLLKRISFPRDLSGRNLHNSNLRHIKIINPISSYVDLSSSHIFDCGFYNTEIQHSTFRNSKIANTVFQNVLIQNTDFIESNNNVVTLHKVKVDTCYLDNSNWQSCHISDTDIKDASFHNSRIDSLTCSNMKIRDSVLTCIKISESRLANNRIEKVDLSTSEIYKTMFNRSTFKLVNWRYSLFQESSINNSSLHKIDLTNSRLNKFILDFCYTFGLRLNHSKLVNSQIQSFLIRPNFDNVYLGNTNFNLDLDQFKSLDLTGARIDDTEREFKNLSWVDTGRFKLPEVFLFSSLGLLNNDIKKISFKRKNFLPEVIEEIKKSNHSEKSWETGAVEIINSRMAKHRKLKQEMMYGKYISAVILVLLADPKRRTIPKLTGSKEEIIESLSEGLD